MSSTRPDPQEPTNVIEGAFRIPWLSLLVTTHAARQDSHVPLNKPAAKGVAPSEMGGHRAAQAFLQLPVKFQRAEYTAAKYPVERISLKTTYNEVTELNSKFQQGEKKRSMDIPAYFEST